MTSITRLKARALKPKPGEASAPAEDKEAADAAALLASALAVNLASIAHSLRDIADTLKTGARSP